MGIYFSNMFASVIGFFCVLLGLYSTKARPVAEAQKEGRKTKHTIILSEPPEQSIMPWEVPEFPASAAFPKDAENFLNDDIRALTNKLKKATDEKEIKELEKDIKTLKKEKKKIVEGQSGINFLPLPDYGSTDPLEKIFLGLPIRFLKKV